MFADEFAKFLSDFDAEKFESQFYEHFKYGMADVYIKNDEIVAAILWGVSQSGSIMEVAEIFVKPNNGSRNIFRFFAKRAIEKFPRLKYFKFYRGYKVPNGKARMYKLSTLIKEN